MKKTISIFLVGLFVGWITVPIVKAGDTLPFIVQKDDMDHAGVYKILRRIVEIMTQLALTSQQVADNTKQIADNTRAIKEKLEAK